MSAGLKEQWGLNEATSGGSDQQANEFRAAFNAAIGPVKQALTWTATNAEQSKHDEKSTLRDQALEKFQSVMSTIDPEDSSKAESAIQQCLSETSSLSSVVDTFKSAVETAKQAWEALVGALQEVSGKVSELEEWGHDLASTYLELIKKIQDYVAKRCWEEAKAALEDLVSQLEAVYEEYLRQKEAKEKYETDLPSVKDVFEALKQQAEEVAGEAADLARQIAEGLDQAADLASAKKFVEALLGLGPLAGLLDRLKQHLEEQGQKKEEYEKVYAELQPRLEAARQPTEFALGKSLQASLQRARDGMESAANGGDYESALSQATDIVEPELVGYEDTLKTAEEEKKEYDTKYTALKPRIDAAAEQVTNPTLEAQQEAILTKADEMEGHASAGSYDLALTAASTLETGLAGFETGKKDHEAEKQEYENRMGGLGPRFDKIAEPTQSADLQQSQQQIAGARADIEAAAGEGNYDKALKWMDQAEAQMSRHEERVKQLEEKKKEYDTKLKGLEPKLKEAKKAPPHESLKPLQTELVANEDAARAAAGSDDYTSALQSLDYLGPALDVYAEACVAMENAQEEYESREPDISARYAAAAGTAGIKNARALGMLTEMEVFATTMTTKAGAGDYEDALAALFLLKAHLAAFESLLEKLEKLKEEYETRYAALEPKFDEAAAAVTHEILTGLQARVAEARTAAHTAATAGDHETALPHLDDAEAHLAAFNDFKEDVEEERAQYESRLQGLTPRLAKADHPVEDPEAQTQQDHVKTVRADMEAKATAEDFDEALATMDNLEVQLTMLEDLVKQHEDRKTEYTNRATAIKQRLNAVSGTVDDPELKAAQQAVLELHNGAEAAAGSGDYKGALFQMGMLETQIKIYEAMLARHESSSGADEATTGDSQQSSQSAGANPFDQPAGGDDKVVVPVAGDI